MTLQEQIIQMAQKECTEKDKEVISAYLIERFKNFPTSYVYLESISDSVYCGFSGGHARINVPDAKLGSTKEWLLSEGFFITRWTSPGGMFCGYKIYLKKEYA